MDKTLSSRVIRFVAGVAFAVCMVTLNASALGERPEHSGRHGAPHVLKSSDNVKVHPRQLV
jgi:hypothetical protein